MTPINFKDVSKGDYLVVFRTSKISYSLSIVQVIKLDDGMISSAIFYTRILGYGYSKKPVNGSNVYIKRQEKLSYTGFRENTYMLTNQLLVYPNNLFKLSDDEILSHVLPEII